MGYATKIGRAAGKAAGKAQVKVKRAGAGVGGYAQSPGRVVGSGVGGYPAVSAAGAVGAATGAYPAAAVVGTPPRAPTPSAPANLDSDPGVLAAQDTAQYTNQRADDQSKFNQRGINSDYGFTGIGANGIPIMDAVNNPYSRAGLLLDHTRKAHTGNTNSYAASGQLYSGSLQNAQDETSRQGFIGMDQLDKGYLHDSGTNQQTWADAYANAGHSVSAAQWAALISAITGGK